MSSESLAWFDFFLNPSLLEEHLNKPNPDPSPINLIVQFIFHGIKINDVPTAEAQAVSVTDQVVNEKMKRRLSVLSLKIAAFLNWNIDFLQQSLPLHIEDALMSGLLIETMDEHSNPTTHTTLDPAMLLPHQLYSVALYHRYALSVIIKAKLPSKPQKMPNVPIPGQQDLMQESREVQDAIIGIMERGSENSIRILEQMLSSGEIRVPTLQSFSMPVGEGLHHQWHLCKYVPDEQFKCQIHYDLGVFHFLQERFADAFHHFSESLGLLPDLGASPEFCNVEEASLRGYHSTCANICGRATPLEKRNLYDRYNHSLNNNYDGLVEILADDNTETKIPFYLRQSLQLDLMTNIDRAPEGLLFQVQTLNTIREVLEGRIWDNLYSVSLLQSGKMRVQFLVQMLVSKLIYYNPTQRGRIRVFIKTLAMSEGLREILVPQLMSCAPLMSLFTHEEIVDMWQGNEDKTGATKRAFDTSLRADYSDISDLIWDLIHSYDFRLLERAFNCYLTAQPPRPNIHKSDVIDLNAKWKDMIPMHVLNVAVKVLPEPQRGLVLLYIAKAEELSLAKSFPKSLELLTESGNLVRNLLGGDSNRLSKMLSWLILMNKIQRLVHELPRVEESEIQKLTGEAKQCLGAMNNREGVVPWTKVVYWCITLLLNAQDWATLLGGYLPSPSHFPLMHLVKPLAAAAQALQEKINNEKPWIELFHIVLSILMGSIQHKRPLFGQISDRYRDSSVIMTHQVFMDFLENVKEPYCLSIFISLLGHLFNILTEEPERLVHIDHLGMWPRHINQDGGGSQEIPSKEKNSNEWKIVNETLTWVVDHATQLYPSGLHTSNAMCASWFQTKGDVAFYHKDDYKAIQNYLTTIFVATDYLHNDSNLPDQLSLDDAVLKRMIKCSMNLGCYTQAAILCQFLETIDYSTAVGCLQERNSIDAMDAYYNCLWDVTLMEFIINMHQKKGETQRRDQVMKIIGLLEINSNNNEEIQREAAKVRKHRFLRALAKQYL